MINEAMLVSDFVRGLRSGGNVNRELMMVKRYTTVQHCQKDHAEGDHTDRRALHVTSLLSFQPCLIVTRFRALDFGTRVNVILIAIAFRSVLGDVRAAGRPRED